MNEQLKPYEMMHRDPIGGTVVNSLWYRKEDADTALSAKDARIAELEAYICYADEVSTCAEQLLKMIQIDACDVTKDMVAVLRLDAALKELEYFDNTCADVEAAATPSEDGGEVPEVVAHRPRPVLFSSDGELLMTVAQHSRIVAAKDAEIARLCKLAYIGEHHFEDCTYKFRLEELRAQPARQVGGDEREANCTVQDCLRWSGADTDYHGKLLFTVGEFERFVELVSKRAVARAALAPAAVVMPERKSETAPPPFERGYNAALDEVARLNRRAIPVELLKKQYDRIDYAAAMNDTHAVKALTNELRALLGKEGE